MDNIFKKTAIYESLIWKNSTFSNIWMLFKINILCFIVNYYGFHNYLVYIGAYVI